MRGGYRPGAGRKLTLDQLSRWNVGAQCQSLFDRIWKDAELQRLASLPGADVRRQILSELHSIPVPERRQILESAAGQELLSESEQAIRAMRGTPDFVERANRVFERQAPRPKGCKAAIRKKVAEQMSERLGIALSDRLVRECWDEYRALLKRLAEEDRLKTGCNS